VRLNIAERKMPEVDPEGGSRNHLKLLFFPPVLDVAIQPGRN
jgi:hypothetical protein